MRSSRRPCARASASIPRSLAPASRCGEWCHTLPNGVTVAAMTPNVAKCLVVSKVLVADGMMTDDERAFLGALMTKLGLSETERETVVELEGLDDAEPIV